MLGVLFLNTLSSQATEWKVEKDHHDIVVETRVTELSPIKEFRATTTVEAPLSALVGVLDAVETHPEWMADIVYAERLQESPEVLHYNIDTPFPLKDRYIVVEVLKTSDDNSYRFEMSASEAEPTAIDDQERIPMVQGYWQFDRIDDNTTRVMYQFLSDPGINMPDWVVNMFIVGGPYKTLKNLRKMVE